MKDLDFHYFYQLHFIALFIMDLASLKYLLLFEIDLNIFIIKNPLHLKFTSQAFYHEWHVALP